MHCSSPRTVSFHADGKTISWSQKNFSKEFAPFQLPCGKCIACRLNYAKEWAIRCIHEAKMHQQNSFITLTYDDHNLKPKLDYSDFQLFMKKLRKTTDEKIGFFATGEYGDKTKRPHWHAIIFNWYPKDAKYKYSNFRGDEVHSSIQLDKLWNKGISEVGSVTIESAGYCARYAAKKLAHGYDDDHEWHPISKKSNKQAIGKTFLEKYFTDIFNHGYVIIEGKKSKIPRYYEKWLQKNHPLLWENYVKETKRRKIEHEMQKGEKRKKEDEATQQRIYEKGQYQQAQTRQQAQKIILEEKFKRLHNYNKGDI